MRIALIILIFCFSDSTFAQNQSHSLSAVTEFFNLLDNFIKDYDGNYGLTKNYSREEVFELAKKYYKAIAENPIGYNKHIMIDYNEYAKKKKADINYNNINPTLKRAIFISLLKKKLGEKFTGLIGIPYFLRVNIKEITHSIYISSTDSMKFGQTNLSCTIEDVIKGTNRFKPNDTIVISFLNWWLGDCNTNFRTNNSYFVPVIVWKCNRDTCNEFAWKSISDENCGIYPIVNDLIKTPGNYFNTGEISKWADFRNDFIKNYVDWFD